MTEQGQSSRVSRRTIAKGAAWAVPVVPLAVATPAYAQSGVCLEMTLGGLSCKWPGSPNNWSYNLQICFTNTCDVPQTIYYDHLENNAGKLFDPCTSGDLPDVITIPANTTVPVCFGPFPYRSTASAGTIELWGSATSGGTVVKLLSMKTTGNDVSALGICQIPNPCTV